MPPDDSHPDDTSAWDPPHTPKTPPPQSPDASLRRELAGVRSINEAIEGIFQTLENTRANMTTVHSTVDHASTLLRIYTRILSQTEHNQRLLLNPAWAGSTQDMADLEAEAQQRQRLSDLRAQEDARRRDEMQRRLEAEDRQKQTAAATPAATRGATRGTTTRGLVRGSRGGRARGLTPTARAGSNIGRGSAIARGRGTVARRATSRPE